MSTHLDVPSTSHTGKLMVAPPRLNLRRAASYNLHDRGPLSATSSSSHFSFNHLLFSPPPSPGLPALIPKPRRSSLRPRPSRVFRLIFALSGLVALAFFVASVLQRVQWPVPTRNSSSSSSSDNALSGASARHSLVLQNAPNVPAPILVSTGAGHGTKWTVSIPPTHRFPLSAQDYDTMCAQCREVSFHARVSHGSGGPQAQTSMSTTAVPAVDRYFIDVKEAMSLGLLPGHLENRWKAGEIWDAGDMVGLDDETMEKAECGSTMTFVLEANEAGLGNTLMQLWTMYGLAKKQGRSFFIDDSRWAYGKYVDMFQPPPPPPCRPPSRQEMVPCPAQARHLVVSAITVATIFPRLGSLGSGSGNGNGGNADEEKPRGLYDLAREGYQALFKVCNDDKAYVETRIGNLVSQGRQRGGAVVGMHVRRGDRHPLEYQYQDSYIPATTFTEKARMARHSLALALASSSSSSLDPDYDLDSTTLASTPPTPPSLPLTVIASDDPTVYESEEFSGSLRAQERIRLASKSLLQKVKPDPTHIRHFVDDAFGWEGGFFAPMFWNLGATREGGRGKTGGVSPSADTMRLRSLLGRAYVMDLAVLAGASDTIVCTVSAMGCRLLGVMMGWEQAMEGGRWMNVDGDYGWAGLW